MTKTAIAVGLLNSDILTPGSTTLNIREYISEEVCVYIRDAIAEAGGVEVFFVGRTSNKKLVESAEVLARGNSVEVPAITSNCRPGDVVIHNHPSGHLTPSKADNSIASRLGNDGIGFYIVNNLADDVFVSVEPAVHQEAAQIDEAALQEYLAPGGMVAQKLENFEVREPQREMLASVAEAFNSEKIALIEAGTGTGKTIAYLLPAILWSIANQRRVVISTNTINLQQQLIEKDIPLLKKVVPQKFQAELVKGRSNYICLRKLNEAVKQPSLLDIENAESEVFQLARWAQETKDGSKSDLAFNPSDKVWEQVQSESDTSLKKRCPYYSKCFFYNARRRATTANILVANHHLLFADLSVRSSVGDASEVAVLPKYERVILDEAHNLEDVASRYFGVRITWLGVLRALNRLTRVKNQKVVGLLPFLYAKLNKNYASVGAQLFDDLDESIEEAKSKVDIARRSLSELVDRVFHWLTGNNASQYQEVKLRIQEQVRRGEQWAALAQESKNVVAALYEIPNAIDKLNKRLARVPEAFEKEARSSAVDLNAQAGRLEEFANGLSAVMLENDETNIRWLEARASRYGPIVRFHTAPLDVSPIMRNAVFQRFPTVVMTSATLSVNKSFEYIGQRLGLHGLDAGRVTERILSAPFDYHEQAIIGIPTDIPPPNAQRFAQVLPDYLQNGVLASKGRAFVLFTSYSLLNQMFNALEAPLAASNITLLKQGAENRHRLLSRFRSDKSSVLFATDSFWEGVDVQGDALINVIIPRLPFRVPSEPVIEARVEAIEKQGGSSFMDYTVPQAVLKFKQGFGRLIRSKTDYGSILIFDQRVVSKNYGRLFLASLPETEVVVGAREDVFRETERFLSKK